MKTKTAFGRVWPTLLVLASVCLLQACSDGTTVAPVANVPGTDVPETATTNVAAAMLFVKEVVDRGEADQSDSLEAGEVVLATSETDEPDETI